MQSTILLYGLFEALPPAIKSRNFKEAVKAGWKSISLPPGILPGGEPLPPPL